MTPSETRAQALAVLLPVAAVIVATAAFQLGASIAKQLFPAVGPEGAATQRLILGAAILLVATRPWRVWPARAPLAPIVGLGVACAGAILFFYMAIGRLPQGVAIALQFLGPLGVAIAGSRRPRDFLWAALAAAGVWALVGRKLGAGPGALDPLGVAFALAAAACWAGYILTGRLAGQTFKGAAPALATSIAALIVLPVGVHHAGAELVRPDLIPLAFVVAVVSVAIPFSLELYALPRLPARTFAVLTSLEPAFGALAGFALLHERLAPSQLLGVAAVIAAAAGSAWTSRAPRPAPSATPAEVPPV